MFLQGAGRKVVMDFLTANGMSDAESSSTATEAYKSVRQTIQEMKAAAGMENANPGERAQAQSSGDGIGAILIGILLIIGGVVATMSTDSIWYGAILVGAVSLIKGFAQRMN